MYEKYTSGGGLYIKSLSSHVLEALRIPLGSYDGDAEVNEPRPLGRSVASPTPLVFPRTRHGLGDLHMRGEGLPGPATRQLIFCFTASVIDFNSKVKNLITMAQILDDKSEHCIPFIVDRLAEHKDTYHKAGKDAPPFFIGLNGVQGAGKTTLVGLIDSW